MSNSSYYKEIINKLERLIKREQFLLAAIGIQAALIISIAFFTTLSLLEMTGHFSSVARTVFFFLFLVISLGSLLFLFLIPVLRYFNIFRRTDYYSAAYRVGRNFPGIKDDLLNAMQLVSIDNNKYKYSEGLINAAFFQIYNSTRQIKFEKIINFNKAKRLFLFLILITVFCTALFLFAPGLQSASGRIIDYNKEFIPPQKFSFRVEPGNAQLTKGDNINISIAVRGEKPLNVFIAVKDTEQTDFEFKPLTADSTGKYNYAVKSVRSSFRYFAAAEEIKSDEFSVEVIDRPIIKTLDVKINSPSYSEIPEVNQRDNGNITALKGSIVTLGLTSTKDIKNAVLLFSDSTKTDLDGKSQNASGSFKVTGDINYKIVITDFTDNQNSSPITYTIKSLSDTYPEIEVISPAEDVDLANDNRLPLFLKINDDYGFTKLLLKYRLASSKYEEVQKDFSSIEIPINKKSKDSEVSYIWNLSSLNLASEDIVAYYLEIFDNDFVSGPKSTKSETYAVRVPSLDEILARANNTQQEVQQDLRETLKEAEELKRNLEKIDQDLKQNKKEITWEEKENIEKALDKFQKLQEKIENSKKELSQMQQELQENNLLSEETLEKYMELQKLMEEFTSEEMKQAMERMQNMLQNMDRRQIQEAMKNLQMDEERFKKSIERTISLLKRLQIEQKVDELLNRSEQLAEKQEEINKETTEKNLAKEQDKNRLSKQQEKISEEIEQFEKEMENLSDLMKELEDMPHEEMEKLQQEFENQENQELSEEAKQNIQQNKKESAQQLQQQLSKNMQQMNKQMQQLQESINHQNLMQTFTDMMRVMDNLVTLSKQQEELQNETNESEQFSSSSLNEKAEKQNDIKSNLDKIMQQMSNLSQKTFAISPEMGKSLGDARNEMSKSTQSLQNRNSNLAEISQKNAMKSINEAATMMKNSMEAMMQGSQGQGGMMSLMQQLNQMSQQQMNLNNLTQMLQQNQQGKLSPQQQAQLQRLAQQQELIRKSMAQLSREAKESGQASKIPADLQNIERQMQEVISGMNTEKLDDNLIQKQERILSKLLDAQRSVNERDFEKNRESESGQNIARKSPAELNLSSEDGKDKIRDELNRAVQEGYSRDYEELIRKYYEALQKEEVRN